MGAVAVKGFSSLLEIDGRTRLRHSWVEIFPGEVSIGEALQKAWKTYRSPLEPDDIFQISDSQVVRWRWSGRLQLQVEVKWDVAKGWTFPGKIPPFQLQQTIVRGAGLDAQFRISQRGQFFIQVSKRKGRINFSLQRSRERQERKVFSAGFFAENPVRIKRLQWRQPEILDVVSEATSRPLLRQLNRVFEEALVKRMEIAFAIEHNRWKRSARLLHATWSRPRRDTFVETYAQLLQGQIPQPGPRLSFRGKFEQIRGTRLKVNLNLLDWIRVGKSTEKREEQRVLLSPSGEVVIEKGRVLEKTTYRWDEIQFLRVLYRKTADQSGQSLDFLWTFGQEDHFSYDALNRLLQIALHSLILPEFTLPSPSAFPLKVRLLLVTSFSSQGLSEVRQASPDRKWNALVRALEVAEPGRYGTQSFWRDWIDYPKLRKRIDRDPIQTRLETRYPVAGRREFERIQVIAAYRKAKRFLALLEHWKSNEQTGIFKVFDLGMDIPIFVFFHLLCRSSLRRSAALMSGGLERVWGETSLLSEDSPT